ncbi:MAG TPA: hypothetical protein VIL79_05045 [Thermoleophilia bacterium]
MTDEKPHQDTSGEEFTRGTLGAQQSIRMNLSASQLHDHENEPSWKAPHEKSGRWSTSRVITLIVLLATLAIVIVLKATGAV